MCTKDARTRFSHGMADGQIVEGPKTPFKVGGYKMMFPGDKSLGAPGHEIYNCRCTTRTVEKDGIEAEPRQMRVKNPETGEWKLVNEMTYSAWEKWKNALANSEKGGNNKYGLQFFARSSKDYKTVELPKQEYAHVMSELATHLTAAQRKQKVITKAIGNYVYTVENNGFGNYRIIGKEIIDNDIFDWWEE